MPAICRLLRFGQAWGGFRPLHPPKTVNFGSALHPMGLLALLHVPVFSMPTLVVLGAVYPIVATSALAGFAFPVTGLATASLGLYMDWLLQSSGKINHGGLLFTCALFPIAFSRAADAWSVDALIRRLRGKPAPAPSPAYRWPQRFISLMVATMYGSAGMTKLVRTGWSWGYSDSLRLHFLSHQFTHHPPTQLGPWLARWPALCRVLGVMSLTLEVSSPLSQLSTWAYRIIMPSLALMQLGIFLIMGVLFREMIPIFLCLLPWEQMLESADALVRRRTRSLA